MAMINVLFLQPAFGVSSTPNAGWNKSLFSLFFMLKSWKNTKKLEIWGNTTVAARFCHPVHKDYYTGL